MAGHRGLAGSAVWRALAGRGFDHLVGATSSEVDLRDREATMDFVSAKRPDVMVVAAARVGGILANDTYPAEFLSDNLRIQVNLMDAAREFGVSRLLFLGSSCIYEVRRAADQGVVAAHRGPGAHQRRVRHRQDRRHHAGAVDPQAVRPALHQRDADQPVRPGRQLRRHQLARDAGPDPPLPRGEAGRGGRGDDLGSGTPRREFLHVDDLASALVFLLENYDSPETINVGTGIDVTIRELAETIADVVGWSGRLRFDTSKPDGTPRKLLDVSRLRGMGWAPSVSLRDGVESTYRWFTGNLNTIRVEDGLVGLPTH